MATEWRITHNSGRYRIEYLFERRARTVIGVLKGLPKEDVWIPSLAVTHDSFESAEESAKLLYGEWEPVNSTTPK